MVELKIQLEADVAERLSVEAQSLGYESTASFVTRLVAEHVDASGPASEDAALEELLLSRLDGPFEEFTDESWATLQKRIDAELAVAPSVRS